MANHSVLFQPSWKPLVVLQEAQAAAFTFGGQEASFVPPFISAIVCATCDAVELLYDAGTATYISLRSKPLRLCPFVYIRVRGEVGVTLCGIVPSTRVSSMWNRSLSSLLFF